MSQSLRLNRSNILTFLTCRRRFQLHTLQHLPWPEPALNPEQQAAVDQGQNFHRLLEQFFSGLPVAEADLPDQQLLDWWQRFQRQGPKLPEGRRLPEIRLTVPVGNHYLIGRFDLVIIENTAVGPKAHIFDWKTSKPRSISELAADWQTRLYLAMMAQSGTALVEEGIALEAANITLTYWYTDDPGAPRRITYSQAKHEENWAEIQAIVTEINNCLEDEQWPLTANWSHCRQCPYQAYCGRWEAGRPETTIAEEPAPYDIAWDFLLEPETP